MATIGFLDWKQNRRKTFVSFFWGARNYYAEIIPSLSGFVICIKLSKKGKTVQKFKVRTTELETAKQMVEQYILEYLE